MGTFSGWTAMTLLNSWANLGAPYSAAAFRLMPDGTVALRGVIINGTKTDGTVVATLPVGCRPLTDKIINPVPISSGIAANSNFRVRAASGNIEIFGVSASTTGNCSFDTLRFDVT